ncbi:MAG: oligosaccharide flippase family protein, partial [Planctomycetes bacterium]|nr:oligosaccharide flippase family protein [Planctomycetota bacterium]
PFALTAVASTLYLYLDSVILGLMKPIKDVGWYNAAYQPILLFSLLHALFASSILPTISRLYVVNKKEFFLL